ncbi:hypothetical protein [uncultured Paludibaculum sp.]|uniref:hypothetical protein n=1 Tax=uncultured Paludibaculum sp. TaxID=1765020 RepID=UPI002AAC25D3|nr:hypothetical protein [uncultured Paludibaculum sp.]
MSYARARLGLGILNVGFLVLLTALAYAYQMPSTFFPYYGGPWYTDWAGFLVVYLAYALLSMPFDIWGGFSLPCRYQRMPLLLPGFLVKWIRGLAVQALVMTLSATLLLEGGKHFGLWGAAVTLLLLQLVLLFFQWPLARWTGGLSTSTSAQGLIQAAGFDSGFTGGPAGLPGLQTTVHPAAWSTSLSSPALFAEHLRHEGLIKTGTRTRGVLLAMAWNLLGFVLSASLPWSGVDTIFTLLETLLGCTLWSFLGLLILPSFSRPGTLEADRYAAKQGASRAQLEAAICEIDQLQGEELSRPRWVETIFHPVPSVENRLNALDSGHQPYGAWLAARTALYLSWANFGILSRAVHSNIGRPELWVLPPGD